MVKTTPPGRSSRLLGPLGDDEIHGRHVRQVAGVPLTVTGTFDENDLVYRQYRDHAAEFGVPVAVVGKTVTGATPPPGPTRPSAGTSPSRPALTSSTGPRR